MRGHEACTKPASELQLLSKSIAQVAGAVDVVAAGVGATRPQIWCGLPSRLQCSRQNCNKTGQLTRTDWTGLGWTGQGSPLAQTRQRFQWTSGHLMRERERLWCESDRTPDPICLRAPQRAPLSYAIRNIQIRTLQMHHSRATDCIQLMQCTWIKLVLPACSPLSVSLPVHHRQWPQANRLRPVTLDNRTSFACRPQNEPILWPCAGRQLACPAHMTKARLSPALGFLPRWASRKLRKLAWGHRLARSLLACLNRLHLQPIGYQFEPPLCVNHSCVSVLLHRHPIRQQQRRLGTGALPRIVLQERRTENELGPACRPYCSQYCGNHSLRP